MVLNIATAIRAVLSGDGQTVVSADSKEAGLRGKLKKVVLAYSGGLDTSVIVPWLKYVSFLSLQFISSSSAGFETISLYIYIYVH